MLRNFVYTLMAGSLLGAFGWMRTELGHADSRSLAALPGPDMPVISHRKQRVLAREAGELLEYVSWLRLDGHSASNASPAATVTGPGIDNERAALLNRLNAGMKRDEVVALLGDPEAIGDDQSTWVYDIATILFDENGVAGWLDTSDEAPARRSMSDALAPWGAEVASDRDPAAPRSRPQVVAPVASRSGSASGGSSYRRPLDRMLNRNRAGHGRYTNSYRKPIYLRNMFQTTTTGRQQRTPPPYARSSY